MSHHVRLVNGGEVRFAYALDGHLLELSGDKVAISIKPGGKVMFDIMAEPEP